ncbi:MAG TPA: hypothetical protein VJ346_04330, partial [Bacteroidales bacterium]|nr:hypothetical protein [Bacteroidales bacterium]
MKYRIITLMFLAGLIVISCNNDDDNNGPQPSGKLVYIENDIEIPTTWYADSIYIIEDWDFWV